MLKLAFGAWLTVFFPHSSWCTNFIWRISTWIFKGEYFSGVLKGNRSPGDVLHYDAVGHFYTSVTLLLFRWACVSGLHLALHSVCCVDKWMNETFTIDSAWIKTQINQNKFESVAFSPSLSLTSVCQWKGLFYPRIFLYTLVLKISLQ